MPASSECLRRPGVPMPGEYRVRHKDGTLALTSSRSRSTGSTIPRSTRVVVNYRDVTDRRLAEQALRASEERLRHIVEHAQDLIYYCDATAASPTSTRPPRGCCSTTSTS